MLGTRRCVLWPGLVARLHKVQDAATPPPGGTLAFLQ